jgi:hypothetical protein
MTPERMDHLARKLGKLVVGRLPRGTQAALIIQWVDNAGQMHTTYSGTLDPSRAMYGAGLAMEATNPEEFAELGLDEPEN